jgi:hypothetical protein
MSVRFIRPLSCLAIYQHRDHNAPTNDVSINAAPLTLQLFDRVTQPIIGRLFSDAEAAEDAVEDVVGVYGAGDLAEFIEGRAQFEGDEFFFAAVFG